MKPSVDGSKEDLAKDGFSMAVNADHDPMNDSVETVRAPGSEPGLLGTWLWPKFVDQIPDETNCKYTQTPPVAYEISTQTLGDDKAIEDDGSESAITKCLRSSPFLADYLVERWKSSGLCDYWECKDLRKEDVDAVVTNFTVVQALLLTIPPTFVTAVSISSGTWEALKAAIDNCNIDSEIDDFSLHVVTYNVYYPLFTWVCGVLLGTMTGILLALTYFILRPRKDEAFTKWYRGRGLYGVLIIYAFMVLSLMTTGLMLTYYGIWFAIPQAQLCVLAQGIADGNFYYLDPYQRNALGIVYGALGFSFCVAFLIMF
jgi:hypothetical protein